MGRIRCTQTNAAGSDRRRTVCRPQSMKSVEEPEREITGLQDRLSKPSEASARHISEGLDLEAVRNLQIPPPGLPLWGPASSGRTSE